MPLPELATLQRLAPDIDRFGQCEVLATVDGPNGPFPIHALSFGPRDPAIPVLIVVGGVHGLERIGTQVVLAYLTTLLRRLEWDAMAQRALAHARVAFVPLVNPVGMASRRRANGSGVDLMRNAPVHPDGWGTPLLGGQRISPRLPWFMGYAGAPMEAEAAALVDFVQRIAYPSRAAICLDVHSGFGFVDRLWFPYARTRTPFPRLPEVFALKSLLDRTLPNHVYRIEPQAQSYTIQGDLWDHVFDAHEQVRAPGVLVPITLEMGSWMWVKKNPRQLMSALGGFNPVVPHRVRRTLRRHLALIDFLYRAVASPDAWSGFDAARREALRDHAFSLWYGR